MMAVMVRRSEPKDLAEGGVVEADANFAVVKLAGDPEEDMFVELPSMGEDRKLLSMEPVLVCTVSSKTSVSMDSFQPGDCSSDG
jgi:hypothetical protein